jgi:hypothetical protein
MNLSIIGLIIATLVSASLPHELCKSDDGKLTLSEKTKILTKFKDESETETILIEVDQELSLQEIFTFTCQSTKSPKGTEITNNTYEIAKVSVGKNPYHLKNGDLSINGISTNTKPIYVKCEAVCEVVFIAVEVNLTSFCNESNVKDWNCGLDQLEEKLAPVYLRSSGFGSSETYGIRNPMGEQPPFLQCKDVNDTNYTYLGIESCYEVLNQLNLEKGWVPIDLPYVATIEVRSVQKRSVEKSYVYKEFWLKPKGVGYTLDTSQTSTTIISVLVVVLIIVIVAYFMKRKRQIWQSFRGNSNKQFDVFISYSHLDKEFVEDFMVQNLEDETNEVKYQCLLHERDFMPGRPIIDQITEAVDNSSCTMIVLSTNFVESQWARQE